MPFRVIFFPPCKGEDKEGEKIKNEKQRHQLQLSKLLKLFKSLGVNREEISQVNTH